MKNVVYDIKVDKVYSTPKDEWKSIVQNAKFDKIEQILATKVGINNFLHISINFQTSVLLRDIILNSPFVSAWGRSTQVLNDTDSKFSVYRSIRSDIDNSKMIEKMEELLKTNHVQDNIRMIVPLGSLTNYAINTDIMTLVKLILVLDCVQQDLRDEATLIKKELEKIALEAFDITDEIIAKVSNSYKDDIKRDFNYLTKNLKDITGVDVISAPVTYSVVGQILRHRTILKNVDFDLDAVKQYTANYDFDAIETPDDIALLVKEITASANSLYETVQGSIYNLNMSGYQPNIQKMFNQRSCCINDTKQFKDIMPANAIPPCKCNVEKFGCYVSYVNESRLKNEEQTQIPCPIWAEAKGLSQWTNDKKYDYFYNNITSWNKWKKRIEKDKND